MSKMFRFGLACGGSFCSTGFSGAFGGLGGVSLWVGGSCFGYSFGCSCTTLSSQGAFWAGSQSFCSCVGSFSCAYSGCTTSFPALRVGFFIFGVTRSHSEQNSGEGDTRLARTSYHSTRSYSGVLLELQHFFGSITVYTCVYGLMYLPWAVLYMLLLQTGDNAETECVDPRPLYGVRRISMSGIRASAARTWIGVRPGEERRI